MAATLLDVSPAVVHAILTHLDTPSLGRLGRVSRRFRTATRDSLLWLGTGRIDDGTTTRVSDWYPRALDVYGPYVTTLSETKNTKTPGSRFVPPSAA
jgi:hypothetical protein